MRNAMLPLVLAVAACQVQAAPEALVPGFAGQMLRVPITSMQAARTATTVLQKYDFSCGSAAISTLLTHHYGHPVSEQEVLQEMYAKGDQQKIRQEGFSMLDMKQYLESLGYAADGFQQPLEKLAEAGLPAIVLVNEGNYHHFVVVKGLRDGRVLIGDPARGTRALTREEFEKLWLGGLLFVIHDHVQQARFNLASDWRAAPRAPVFSALPHDGLAGTGLPRNGPGDF
ncbi:C39 family peptidase [Ramlibacter ginsenosidimutans]|uniref:C39 family peptidase n=1 Tax=Ramlibacter ginsenosidimutans TaxID=502333 RepID=A0A934TS55_9BURK|nr:C39 family peptidase [Ramlibacter ginsenosidimutans]MBK6006398.1 C39 family peptidase [Ramlibacter ginsenosidimutans]